MRNPRGARAALDGLEVLGQLVLGVFVLKVLLVSLGVRHLRLQQHNMHSFT